MDKTNLLSVIDIYNVENRQAFFKKSLEDWVNDQKDMNFSFPDGDRVIFPLSSQEEILRLSDLKISEVPNGVAFSALVEDDYVIFIKNPETGLDLVPQKAIVKI